MKIRHFGIIFLATVAVILVVRAADEVTLPLCRYRVEEGVYTCFMTDASISPPLTNDTISGEHDDGKSDADVLRVYNNESATDLVIEVIFKNFVNLEILEFPFGTLENISDHFTECAKLKKLHITRGLFKSVPANTFSACTQLEELDLGGNAINSLDKDSFAGLTPLTKLKLNNNKLITIPANIFDHLPNLKVLDISSNENLRTFSDNVFKNNTNLEELNIASNKFDTLKKEYFEGLTELTKLDATSSEVNAIEEAVFDKLSKLRIALFKSNKCVDEDFQSYQSSDKSKFQKCIDNFNGSSIMTMSKFLLPLLFVLQYFW